MNNSDKIIGGILLCTISTGITIELVDKHKPQAHTHVDQFEVTQQSDQLFTTQSGGGTATIYPTNPFTGTAITA